MAGEMVRILFLQEWEEGRIGNCEEWAGMKWRLFAGESMCQPEGDF